MINSNSDLFKQGSVWLAKVYFKNEGQFKKRPVVIVGNEFTIDIDVLISPITSSEQRSEYDIVIEYWKESGLITPSIARTTKLASIPKSEMIKKLGTLHEHDIKKIKEQCQKLF